MVGVVLDGVALDVATAYYFTQTEDTVRLDSLYYQHLRVRIQQKLTAIPTPAHAPVLRVFVHHWPLLARAQIEEYVWTQVWRSVGKESFSALNTCLNIDMKVLTEKTSGAGISYLLRVKTHLRQSCSHVLQQDQRLA